jgi:ATP phosphoribosyltransferase regulatory subunit
VADYFWGEALERQQLMDQLLASFRAWGYGDVMPPMFDYAASLGAQASPELIGEMYRFLDRDGSTLALRPEFTTPVVRLVATRLHDWPMPQRFCYAGSVFRYTEPQAGRQREFWQAGVELIGAPSPTADAEVVALTGHALRQAGLTSFRLVLGQICYFGGLLQDLHLTPPQESLLRRAIERKSEADLVEFLRGAGLSSQQQRTVEALGDLHGRQIDQTLTQASHFCLNPRMESALANLRAIADTLDAYQVIDWVDIDLTEIRNLGYYTGITFEALAPGLGFDIASGGRYDDLMAHFGHPQPAVGVALGLDRLLLARSRQQATLPEPHMPADVLALTGNAAPALLQVQLWREAGQRVQVEVNGAGPDAACAYARQVGIPQVVVWTDGGFETLYQASPREERP